MEILDVLIDNTLRHGRGTVTVRAADEGTHLGITIIDTGPRPAGDIFQRNGTGGAGEGMSLVLARELAGSIGCHLGLDTPRQTVFTLKLPTPSFAQPPSGTATGSGPKQAQGHSRARAPGLNPSPRRGVPVPNRRCPFPVRLENVHAFRL
ncbi:hypothetical protein GCM10023081_13400 [Arthrobacter ginkgonis]|uniref:Histidine kinase/HSP90-like ATPase domain-containing protein n=1 Tax=Arthrobacter ginkgonis TaxID=1630594 RepID=A0ABP7C1A7_9MICC